MKLLLAVLIFALPTLSFTQSNSVKNRFSFKTSVSRYPTNSFSSDGSKWKNLKTNNYRIETTYGFHHFIEGSAHFGGQKDEFFVSSNKLISMFVPYFGLGVNFHVLPLIRTSREQPIDVYFPVKFGGLIVKSNSNVLYSGYYPEYSIGLGSAFYFFRNFGVFGEMGFGKFSFRNPNLTVFPGQPNLGNDWFKIRVGLNYKFNFHPKETKI